MSARSNSSIHLRSSSSSESRNLINTVEPEITLASTSSRARTSGIQQHEGVSTRTTRVQTGDPHSQLQQQPRQYYRSDHTEYRQGHNARKKEGEKY